MNMQKRSKKTSNRKGSIFDSKKYGKKYIEI